MLGSVYTPGARRCRWARGSGITVWKLRRPVGGTGLALAGVCSSVIGGGPRLFLDEQCVQHRIPMLDPGVSGTLASLQVLQHGPSNRPCCHHEDGDHCENDVVVDWVTID